MLEEMKKPYKIQIKNFSINRQENIDHLRKTEKQEKSEKRKNWKNFNNIFYNFISIKYL